MSALGPVLIILFAPFVGSWLALLVDRLPRGEETVRRRSFCRGCGAALRWWELLPIVSFVALRGRCARCGTGIPPWVLAMELGALALASVAVWLGGGVAAMALSAALLWCLMALAVADLSWLRLPDPLTGALALLGLLWAGLFGDGWQAGLIGAALGSGSFLALRLGYRALRGREGLGLGDVKLMAGIGAMVGPWDLALTVLVSALLALAGAAAGGRMDRETPLPFGTALSCGAALVWIALRMAK